MSFVAKLAWYINRVKVMSPGEVVHRFVEIFHGRLLRLDSWVRPERFAASRYNLSDYAFFSRANLPEITWEPLAANDIDTFLQGHWPALGCDWQFKSSEDVWHIAPDSGKRWPNTFFLGIDYRAGNPYGDIRFLWEPARLQQLLVYAQIAQRTNETDDKQQALELAEKTILSFYKQSPPYSGPHYISAMECGLRIVSLCHFLALMNDEVELGESVRQTALSLIHSHASFVVRRLSLHSSLGNHTLAECLGLLYAGLLFPELPGAQKWQAVALPMLEQEFDRQILPDGGGIEQSSWYHLLTTEMAVLAGRLLALHQQSSPLIDAAAKRGADFLEALAGSARDMLLIGDMDSGRALGPYAQLVFDKDKVQEAGASVRIFEASGYSIFGSENTRLVFKHGPFGMSPAYGHGHADALSIALTSGSKNLLIDPGTYSYTGKAEWRTYFRSSRAHNTVTFAEKDQAEQLSAFMWKNTAAAKLLDSGSYEGVRFVVAEYRPKTPYGARHVRAVLLFGDNRGAGENQWLVWDYVDPGSEAVAELWWHLEADAEVRGSRIESVNGELVLSVDGADSIESFVASTSPVAGWQSPRYGVKLAATTVKCVYTGVLPHEFTTLISIRAGQLTSGSEQYSLPAVMSGEVAELLSIIKRQVE